MPCFPLCFHDLYNLFILEQDWKKKNLQNKKKKLELVGIIPEQSLKKRLAILEQFLQF